MNADNLIPRQNNQNFAGRSRQAEKPGALHGQVWLTIQTSQAQQLIHGRDATPDKPTIIGLVGFANRLRVIWQAARNDDPYADWWLIKVHEAIEVAGADIAHRQGDIAKQLEQLTAMEVSVAASQRPCRVHLEFASPYAYRAAQLLAEYDRLVCTALTACHIGLLDTETRIQVQKACARKLRALFMIPQGYRFLKIDRETVCKATGRSHEASQIMGAVPDDVLSGERHAPLFPHKVKFKKEVAGHMSANPGSSTSGANSSEDKNDDR